MQDLNTAQAKVIKVLKKELTAREAFETIKWIHQLPATHWFWNRPSALRNAAIAAGSLSWEYTQAVKAI